MFAHLMRPALLVMLLAVSGCSAHYGLETRQVRVLSDDGRHDEALAWLEEKAKGAGLDALLVELDRGALHHRAGRWRESTIALNRAAQLGTERELVRFSEELFGKAPWRMGTLDRQALHVMNTLNYLSLGQFDDAAVEARLTNSQVIAAEVEKETRERFEKNLMLVSFDPSVRGYLEVLTVGQVLAGLAHELAGNETDAFLDYHAAWQQTLTAPWGAPTTVAPFSEAMVRLARSQQRQELAALEQAFPNVTPAAPDTGEVVVVVEAGRVPARDLDEQARSVTTVTRAWARGAAEVSIAQQTRAAQTVTSLENLALRRGYLGLLTDTERPGSIAANVTLFFTFLVLPPLGGGLLIKRAYESGTRQQQSWQLLPAELQLVRLRVPAGEHVVTVRSAGGATEQTVVVKPGKLSLVVARTPEAPEPPPKPGSFAAYKAAQDAAR